MEGNKLSIPIAHSIRMKDSYGNVRHLVKHIQYTRKLESVRTSAWFTAELFEILLFPL
jgi:hypothetical protein